MDYQAAFNIAGAIIGVLLAWLWIMHRSEVKEAKERGDSLKTELQTLRERGDELQREILRLQLAFVNKEDFNRTLSEFKSDIHALGKKLDRIYDKLDTKVDK